MSLHIVVQAREAANKPELFVTLAPWKDPDRSDMAAVAYGRQPAEPYAYADTMKELVDGWVTPYAAEVDRLRRGDGG